METLPPFASRYHIGTGRAGTGRALNDDDTRRYSNQLSAFALETRYCGERQLTLMKNVWSQIKKGREKGTKFSAPVPLRLQFTTEIIKNPFYCSLLAARCSLLAQCSTLANLFRFGAFNSSPLKNPKQILLFPFAGFASTRHSAFAGFHHPTERHHVNSTANGTKLIHLHFYCGCRCCSWEKSRRKVKEIYAFR